MSILSCAYHRSIVCESNLSPTMPASRGASFARSIDSSSVIRQLYFSLRDVTKGIRQLSSSESPQKTAPVTDSINVDLQYSPSPHSSPRIPTKSCIDVDDCTPVETSYRRQSISSTEKKFLDAKSTALTPNRSHRFRVLVEAGYSADRRGDLTEALKNYFEAYSLDTNNEPLRLRIIYLATVQGDESERLQEQYSQRSLRSRKIVNDSRSVQNSRCRHATKKPVVNPQRTRSLNSNSTSTGEPLPKHRCIAKRRRTSRDDLIEVITIDD